MLTCYFIHNCQSDWQQGSSQATDLQINTNRWPTSVFKKGLPPLRNSSCRRHCVLHTDEQWKSETQHAEVHFTFKGCFWLIQSNKRKYWKNQISVLLLLQSKFWMVELHPNPQPLLPDAAWSSGANGPPPDEGCHWTGAAWSPGSLWALPQDEQQPG